MANNEPADRQKDLLDKMDRLQRENHRLQAKLDDIDDVLSCRDAECSAEEHLAEIQDILDGNGNDDD